MKTVHGRRKFFGVLAATLMLVACSRSSDPTSTVLSSSPTQAAAASSGPGATDTSKCTVPYGDAPAAIGTLTSSVGSSAAGEILELLNQCTLNGGETLSWTDANGSSRNACLWVPANASTTNRLPLLMFTQGSVAPIPVQLLESNWVSLTATADLTGDPARPGFILLTPLGRNTHHYYPVPDDYGIGWDTWYRNLDRNSPNLNVDVAAIDEFIRQVEARNIVDKNRVYATGWSNGAAMAQLYALNTPSIAASAVYSSPDPYRDIQDPCEQTPFITTLTPLMDIHNSCDIAGICQTGTKFHQDLARMFPTLQQKSVILGVGQQQEVAACEDVCAAQDLLTNPGIAAHLIWPVGWNDAMFAWLREHPLSAKSGQP
ncbi:MAG: hypothetical protein ACRESS_06645 [Stenotrophobium sp.]